MLRRMVFALGVCVALGGCEFKLAGTPGALPDIAQQTLEISGGSAEFRYLLRSTLREQGVRIDAEGAELIVHLQGPERRRRVLAVDQEFDAREYELVMHLTVRLQVPGAEKSEPLTLSRTRNWLFDARHTLAADEERAVLEQEMRLELMEALVLHIQAHS